MRVVGLFFDTYLPRHVLETGGSSVRGVLATWSHAGVPDVSRHDRKVDTLLPSGITVVKGKLYLVLSDQFALLVSTRLCYVLEEAWPGVGFFLLGFCPLHSHAPFPAVVICMCPRCTATHHTSYCVGE